MSSRPGEGAGSSRSGATSSDGQALRQAEEDAALPESGALVALRDARSGRLLLATPTPDGVLSFAAVTSEAGGDDDPDEVTLDHPGVQLALRRKVRVRCLRPPPPASVFPRPNPRRKASPRIYFLSLPVHPWESAICRM